jgi:Protein of unknown function (DUF3667)
MLIFRENSSCPMSNVASAPAAHPAPTHDHLAAPPVGHCLNCHHRLAGPHCHHCGQAARTPVRLTAHHLLHEIPHSLFHVDHGVIYTIREMLLRPGPSIKRYMAGERKPFFSPLSLLLLVGGISAFLFSKLHIMPFDMQQPGVSPKVQQVQQQIMTLIQKYQAWFSILLLPISASVATPLLRRATGYNWTEQLVAAGFIGGAFAAAGLLFIPALAYWSGRHGIQNVAYLMTCSMLAYKTWAYAQLQQVTGARYSTVSRWMRGFFVSLGEYFGTILLFIVGIGIALFLQH